MSGGKQAGLKLRPNARVATIARHIDQAKALLLGRIKRWAQKQQMSRYRIAQEVGMSRTWVGAMLDGKAELAPALLQWAIERGI